MTYMWRETVNMPKFEKLKGDHETEVLIIGGGITGVLCAHMLRHSGRDCMLVEAERIGCGTTGGTTAVVTAQHGAVYEKLIRKFGSEAARDYLEANLEAIGSYAELAERYDFDFSYRDSYIYSLNDSSKLEAEAEAVRSLGFPAEYVKDVRLPLKTAGAVRFPGMADINPLKLIAELSKDLEIYEHTRIEKVENGTAYFEDGSVKAGKIIVASHFPFINTRGVYPLKLYQKRSFVIALENAPKLDGNYADIGERGIYMRNYGNLLAVGGGDHRTGGGSDGFETVKRFIREHFPDAQERYAWAAQDCMSLDNVPYIGRYSRTLPDVYVASGFNEWGMTSAMAAARILSSCIEGHETGYEYVFDPARGLMNRQALVNAVQSIAGLLSPGAKRCPHLGCSLKKNECEDTWDCPCHGSRFDADGKIIDGPSVRRLE